MEEVVIMAFSNGIKDPKMCEKLTVNDTLSTTMELFNLAGKCAKDEEGRMFTRDNPDGAPEDAKANAPR